MPPKYFNPTNDTHDCTICATLWFSWCAAPIKNHYSQAKFKCIFNKLLSGFQKLVFPQTICYIVLGVKGSADVIFQGSKNDCNIADVMPRRSFALRRADFFNKIKHPLGAGFSPRVGVAAARPLSCARRIKITARERFWGLVVEGIQSEVGVNPLVAIAPNLIVDTAKSPWRKCDKRRNCCWSRANAPGKPVPLGIQERANYLYLLCYCYCWVRRTRECF